jgi:flagellar protein FliO/FliZ
MKKVPRRPALRALRAALWLALGATLAAAPAWSQAADLNAVNNAVHIASSVGAGSAAPQLGVGALLQTLLGLAVVIGLVFACAWLARRLGFQPSMRGNVVRTVGSLSLGGKERVAVVEIGDTWLVLGAAPGNVRLLHTLPAGSVDAMAGTSRDPSGAGGADGAGPAPTGTFGTRFRAALADEAKKRFSRSSAGGK